MAKFISIEKPKAGDDPCELWRTVADLIDALNDVSVTITPSDCGSAHVTEGDIELRLDVVSKTLAGNAIPGFGDGTGTSENQGGNDF